MNMRDIQSPPGVWFPTGADQHGSEHWAIKVPAKVVKDEVKFQLGRWKAEYEMVKEFDCDSYRSCANVARYHGRYPKERYLKAEQAGEAKSSFAIWNKWNIFLASMPDDEILSLTKADYDAFFADRDQREGPAE